MYGKIILKKKGRELGYKFFFNPLYHLKYLWRYGRWDFCDEISIGISSYCNLRCENCPNSIYENGLKKNEILMKEDLFYKIIAELKKINYKGRLGFHFFSEPLGDERLSKFVKYAKSQIPKARMVISSNGFLLTLEKYKELVENGIREFTISQYSENIPKNLPEILDYDKEHGHYITFRRFTDEMRENWGGEIEGNILEKPICTYPQNIIMVNPRGEVVCCCQDYHSSVVWGDLKKEELTTIFDKERFKKFRKDVRRGIFTLPMCKKCRGIKDIGKMKKLNFGCGEDIKGGYDNVDIQKDKKIAKSFNFDKFPYPIKDNTYDYVWSRSVLEHLNEPDRVLKELWRICKSNAIIEIIVPHYNNKSAVSDMQHKHFFSDSSFKVFAEEICKINKEGKFEIDSLILVPTIIGKFIPKTLREKLSLFIGGIISYVHVKLKVVK